MSKVFGPMRTQTGKKFGAVAVELDGVHFRDCTFEGTRLIFRGKQTFAFQGCSFHKVALDIEDHAKLTLTALRALQANPGFAESLARFLDQPNPPKGSQSH